MNIFKKALNKFIFLYADMQIRINKPENAVVTLEKSMDKSQPDENLLRLLVSAYWNSQRHGDSLRSLRRLEQLFPDKKGYKWRLGVDLFMLGYFDEALPYFEYCYKEMPENENFHSGLALCYLDLERYDEADTIIAHAIKTAPWNPVMCSAVSLLYLVTARFELIEDYLKRYIEEYPNHYPGYGAMGYHQQYRLCQPAESLIWYSKAESLFSNSKINKYLSTYEFLHEKEKILDEYVEALIKTGRKEQAFTKINRYIKRDRRSQAAKTRLIEYYIHIGDYVTAEQEARRAYQADPKMYECLSLLSAALLEQNRFADARTTAIDFVKRFKENTGAWVALGNSEKRLGNWQAAIDAYRAALKLEPFGPDVLGNLSMCYRRIGMDNKGLHAAKKRVILDPKNPEAWFDLKEIYQSMGQVADAEEAKNKGLALISVTDKSSSVGL